MLAAVCTAMYCAAAAAAGGRHTLVSLIIVSNMIVHSNSNTYRSCSKVMLPVAGVAAVIASS